MVSIKESVRLISISPAVTALDIVLAFSSQKSFNGNDLQLFYSTDFDPSIMSQPSDASWTEITDMATWATSQETTESGNMELHDLTAPIRFAFKYTCEANRSCPLDNRRAVNRKRST